MAAAAHLVTAGTFGAVPLGQVHTGPVRLEELLRRPAWQRDAACLEHPELDFFSGRPADQEAALRVCAACLVRDRCLAFARADPALTGVWGGQVIAERPVRRRGRLVDPAPVSCSCGKRYKTAGHWRSHARGALEARPGSAHQLIAG